jgi:hypothetical protein
VSLIHSLIKTINRLPFLIYSYIFICVFFSQSNIYITWYLQVYNSWLIADCYNISPLAKACGAIGRDFVRLYCQLQLRSHVCYLSKNKFAIDSISDSDSDINNTFNYYTDSISPRVLDLTDSHYRLLLSYCPLELSRPKNAPRRYELGKYYRF